MKHLNRQNFSSRRKASLVLCALLAGASSAYSTVQYTSTSFANSYSNVADSSSTLIPDATGYSALGSFSVDPATLNTVAALEAAFTAFGSATFGGANVAGDPGSYSVSGAVTNPGAAPIPGGTPIYLVFGNEATLGNSGEFAVMDSGSVTPANNPDPALSPFSVDLPGAMTNGAIIHGTMISLIPSPTFDGQIPRGEGTLQLVAIPEPSAALLAFGGFGLFLIRRRR